MGKITDRQTLKEGAILVLGGVLFAFSLNVLHNFCRQLTVHVVMVVSGVFHIELHIDGFFHLGAWQLPGMTGDGV